MGRFAPYSHGRPGGSVVGADAFRALCRLHARSFLVIAQLSVFLDNECAKPTSVVRTAASGGDARLGFFDTGQPVTSTATSKEENVLADFGKKLILGLVAAACVVGAHAAMVSTMVG